METNISCDYPKDSNGRTRYESYEESPPGVFHFFLDHDFIGQCRGDEEKNKERIEIIGNSLAHSKRYSVKFNAQFDDKYRSSKKSKFFQIHQYSELNGVVIANDPIFMLTIHTDDLVVTGQPLLYASDQTDDDKHDFHPSKLTRDQIAEREIEFQVYFSIFPGEMNKIEVWAGGEMIISCNAFVDPQGDPRLKFGLYRDCIGEGCGKDGIRICNIEVVECREQGGAGE